MGPTQDKGAADGQAVEGRSWDHREQGRSWASQNASAFKVSENIPRTWSAPGQERTTALSGLEEEWRLSRGPDGSSIWSSPEESGHECGAVLPDTAAAGGPGTVRRRGCVRNQALAHSSAAHTSYCWLKRKGHVVGLGGGGCCRTPSFGGGRGSGWSYRVPITGGKREPHPFTAGGGHRGESVQYDLYKKRTGPGSPVPRCTRDQAACSSCISLV